MYNQCNGGKLKEFIKRKVHEFEGLPAAESEEGNIETAWSDLNSLTSETIAGRLGKSCFFPTLKYHLSQQNQARKYFYNLEKKYGRRITAKSLF